MSYYRFITGVYKSYWPGLNRYPMSNTPKSATQCNIICNIKVLKDIFQNQSQTSFVEETKNVLILLLCSCRHIIQYMCREFFRQLESNMCTLTLLGLLMICFLKQERCSVIIFSFFHAVFKLVQPLNQLSI